MTDLRKAAEMALERLESHNYWMDEEAIQALRQALAQPEEKMRIEGSGKLTTKPYPDGYESERDFRKALAQPEQEPFGYFRYDLEWDGWVETEPNNGEPLYTAPPKREWVGLTRRELDIATLGLEDLGDCYKAIEAKLKEKNA